MWAEPLRIATYNTELSRRGPGLLLRDIQAGDDPQIRAVVDVIAGASPDVLLLQGIDFDLNNMALNALADALFAKGADYPYRFALRPNAGLRTGRDHDGDGRVDGARDAQGFGRFPGQGGMALLSRYPLRLTRDFTGLLWADLPGAVLPRENGHPFPNAALYEVQRLASVGSWDVAVNLGGQDLHLLAFYNTTPVFDGPEDMNGLRNRDELRLWSLYLDGALGGAPPAVNFVLVGDANLDPADGEGHREAMRALLADPRLQDPQPRSDGGRAAKGGVNDAQTGDPALDTAEWDDTGPGNLRVDYVLPSADLQVSGAGVVWTDIAVTASRHRLVWVDINLQR